MKLNTSKNKLGKTKIIYSLTKKNYLIYICDYNIINVLTLLIKLDHWKTLRLGLIGMIFLMVQQISFSKFINQGVQFYLF